MPSDLSGMSYLKRRKAVDFYTVGVRRMRGDLISLYQFLGSHGNVNVEQFRKVRWQSRTRGYNWKLDKKQKKKKCPGVREEAFFSSRVVDPWNKFRQEEANTTTIGKFKKSCAVTLQWKETGPHECKGHAPHVQIVNTHTYTQYYDIITDTQILYNIINHFVGSSRWAGSLTLGYW